MTASAWVLIGVAGLLAVTDWFAVTTGRRRLEYAAKPATLAVLVVAALVLQPVDDAMRAWFVVALLLSLLGDVFLMLPQEGLFVAGLASFLVAHGCYVLGFLAGGVDSRAVFVGALVVGVVGAFLAPKVLRGARRADPGLVLPVSAYLVVISAMVAFAVGTSVWVAAVGAALFFLSDLAIGWSRFVADFPRSPLVIMATYHVAQILLVVSLTVGR